MQDLWERRSAAGEKHARAKPFMLGSLRIGGESVHHQPWTYIRMFVSTSRVEARERIRGLIDEISLVPQQDRLGIVLKGNLAAMLRLAQNNERPSETDDLLDQIQLVAGAGFEPATFGL